MKTFSPQHIKTSKEQKSERGFTIVETLVAIFILLISTTGPLAFAQSGLRASFIARDQIVAFYLAQDVIETIKNSRDSKALTGDTDPWLSKLGSCTPPPLSTGFTKCNLSYGTTATALINSMSCPLALCPKMKYDATTKAFSINSGVDSKYSRTVFLTEIVKDREAQIIVVVEWDTVFSGKRNIVVQENIYNWVPVFSPAP